MVWDKDGASLAQGHGHRDEGKKTDLKYTVDID